MQGPMPFWGLELHDLFEEVGNLANFISLSANPIMDEKGYVSRLDPVVQLDTRYHGVENGPTKHGRLTLALYGDDIDAASNAFSEFYQIAMGERPFNGDSKGRLTILSKGSKYYFEISASNHKPNMIDGQKGEIKSKRVFDYPIFANHCSIGMISENGLMDSFGMTLYSGTYSGLCFAHDFAVIAAIKSGMNYDEIRKKFLPLKHQLQQQEVVLSFEKEGDELVLVETLKHAPA